MDISFFEEGVQAGFPSPADDLLEKKLDLNEYLIRHPSATFFIRVKGDSMKEAGISPGDILIVDRAEPAKSGRIVLALFNGEFTVKRFVKEKQKITLLSANPDYPSIHIKEGDDFEVWGVVLYAIHKT